MPAAVAVPAARSDPPPAVPTTMMMATAAAGGGKHHHHHHQGMMAGPTAAEGCSADNSGLLFKLVTPRRRQDQFGQDNTRHADYLLAMAVFPTGVRAPLLSDLQKKTEHQCGFEVINKGPAERAITGRHVHIQDSSKQPSLVSGCSRHGSATDSAKKPSPNTSLTGSLKPASDRGASHHQSQSLSSSRRSPSRETPSTERRWVHSSTEAASSASVGEGEKKVRDIRDPLYLNTYCPEERKLRYKKSSLPRPSSRARSWTVSEPNPPYRFARESQAAPSTDQQHRGRAGRPAWAGQGPNLRIDARDVMARVKGRASTNAQDDIDAQETEESASVSGSQALLEVKSYFPSAAGDVVVGDQRDSLRGKQGCLHSKVKQCIKFVKYREKLARSMSVERPLKAEHGRYRPFSTTTIRIPRTSAAHSSSSALAPRHPDPISVEIYKEYIDTIALQTRLVSAANKHRKPGPAGNPVQRNNTVASSYQDSVLLQSVADSNLPTRPVSDAEMSRPSDGGGQDVGGGEGSSQQSSAAADHHRHSSGGGGDTYRRGGDPPGSDPRGVHPALDIVRLSPKAQPPRTSRTSRGRFSAHREGEEELGREVGVRIDVEGGEVAKTHHTIILPNVTKSATTSVCSFTDEFANADET